jgi:hypothetical protein
MNQRKPQPRSRITREQWALAGLASSSTGLVNFTFPHLALPKFGVGEQVQPTKKTKNTGQNKPFGCQFGQTTKGNQEDEPEGKMEENALWKQTENKTVWVSIRPKNAREPRG